jgi:hypothetical protein
MISLYRAGWQLAKVRALMWFALACGIGVLWWASISPSTSVKRLSTSSPI